MVNSGLDTSFLYVIRIGDLKEVIIDLKIWIFISNNSFSKLIKLGNFDAMQFYKLKVSPAIVSNENQSEDKNCKISPFSLQVHKSGID